MTIIRQLLATAAAAIALTACTQNEVFENTAADNAIGFGSYNSLSTKAGSSYVTGTTFADGAQFGVYAYKHTGDIAAPTAAPEFMNNQMVEIVDGDAAGGGTTAYSPMRYWPVVSKVSFLGYYPYDGAGIAISIDGSTHMPKAEFTVQDDIADQVDFMYTDIDETKNLSKHTPSVALNFKHALTRLKFKAKVASKVAGTQLNITLKSITLKGVYNKGVFDFATTAWAEPTEVATDYTVLSSDVVLTDGTEALPSGAQDLWSTDANINANTPLMIPQTLGTAHQLEVVYTQDGKTVTKDLALSGTEAWTPNKSILYTLIIDPGSTITITAKATDWGDGVEEELTPPDISYNDATSTYEIYNDKGFKAFQQLVNGDATTIADLVTQGDATKFDFTTAHAAINGKLINDIDLSSICGNGSISWTPIGTKGSTAYKGTFDGNGKTVSNLYINSVDDYVGLFGYASVAKIKNLGVVDADVTTTYNGTSIRDDANIGGVLGYCNGSTITNCYNTGTVTSTGNYANVGGVAGDNGGTITDCYSTATVTSSGTNANVGGVVGVCNGSKTIKCYSSGNVTSTGTSTTNVGGVVGNNNMNTITIACYSTGNVTSTGNIAYIGGVVGYNANTITACYSTGNVEYSGTYYNVYIGGVVGTNNIATACYSTGSVIGTGSNVGGVVGVNYVNSIAQYCACVSDVGAPDGIGYNLSTGTVTACVANINNIRASEGLNHEDIKTLNVSFTSYGTEYIVVNNGTVEIDGTVYSLRPDGDGTNPSIWSTNNISTTLTGGTEYNAPKLFWQ